MSKAANSFRKALDLSNGKLVSAWRGIGIAMVFLGEKESAIEALQNFVQSGKGSKSSVEEARRFIERLHSEQ